ncbi:MAG: hypothetical protein JSW39_01400 [Desulfobacterales bacterium]|nr:MAG: hypothetical protein JSW39_01400 [Desulfobacterales bacterium]
MDPRFLEFLGHFLISAARGQRQVADMCNWMQQGLAGSEELSALFRKIYGLEEPSGADQKDKEQARQDFQQAFRAYMRLLGMVPLAEYEELSANYEKLKAQSAAQEETIRSLKMLLDFQNMDQTQFVQSMQDLITDQNKIFQQMVKNFWEFGQTDDPK